MLPGQGGRASDDSGIDPAGGSQSDDSGSRPGQCNADKLAERGPQADGASTPEFRHLLLEMVPAPLAIGDCRTSHRVPRILNETC